MTYGDTPPAITASYVGFVNGDSSSSLTTAPGCSTAATSHSSVADSPYGSSCSGAVDPNYTISYSPGSVVVNPASLTVTASDGSMTYGGTPPTITASYAGFKNGDKASDLTTAASCSTRATSKSTVPSSPYPSSCSGASDSNYTISYTAGSVTIDPAPLTITASDGSMTYGGTPPTITVASYEGFQNGETSSNLTTAPGCSTTATSSSPVADSPYASSCSGAVDPNYAISYSPGSVVVNPASLTVTASDATATYGQMPKVSAQYSAFLNGDTAASLTTAPTCTSTDNGTAPVSGSPYVSSCSGAVDSNYSFSYVTGSVTVAPAPLTVTASSATFSYGGALPSITAIYSGFANGDSASSLTAPPTCSTTATSSSSVGTYPSSCSGAADGNYDISYAAGTVTVGQATPTVTVSGQSGQVTGPVTITVTVSGSPGASDPTGPVTVSDENNRCSITSLDASGSGSCALVENASENGKAVTASYSGDTNYTSVSGTTTESVQPAVPKVTLSGPSSAITGWITYSVTVSGNGAQPTGSVVISDGTSSCQAVFAAGLWSCPLQETTGTYQLTATYGGDSNYASTTGSASEVVNESQTSLSVSSPALVFGHEEMAAFSVVITWPPEPSSAPAPPANSTAEIMAGTKTVCTVSLSITEITYVNPLGNSGSYPEYTGTCTPAPDALPAGSYSTMAVFSGASGLFVGSSSTPSSLTVESAPTATTLTVSRTTTTYESEGAETLTALVSEPDVGSSFVTGGVTLKSGTTTLCAVSLVQGLGSCRLSRAQLSIGRHSLVAQFSGTSSLISSSSDPTTVVVDKALTTVGLTLSRGAVTFGSEQRARFSVKVTVPAGIASAPGIVVITSGSKRLCVIGLVHNQGSCSLTAKELPVGSHTVTAGYVGSSKLQASASRGHTVLVTRPPSSAKS